MSDVAVETGAVEATPAVAPAAPEAAPTENPVSNPVPAAPAAIPNMREARSNLRELVRPAQNPAQPRDEGGRFQANPTEAAPAAPEGEVAEPEQGEGSPAGTTGSPEATDVPEGMVVIEVPEGHYLQERGRKHLPPVPKEFENDFRALLNDSTRRSEVQAAMAARDQSQLQATQWEKAALMMGERLEQVLRDPRLAISVAQIREQYGDEVADRHIEAILSEDEQRVSEALQAVQKEWSDRSVQAQAEEFRRQGQARLASKFPLMTAGDIDFLIQAHARAASEGRVPFTLEQLEAGAQRYYQNHPAVRAQTRAQELESAEAARKAEEQRKASEAAAAAAAEELRRANPMGRMSPGVPGAGAEAAIDPRNVNVREARRGLPGLFARR